MNTAQNIQRLQRVLAAHFWQDDTRRYDMEKVTLAITGQKGAYRWTIGDAVDGTHVQSPGSFPSLMAAKESMRGALEEGLRRYRANSPSTQD